MQQDVADALTEAANLLLVGMVVVFLFLSMLIGAITLIAWLNKLFPDPTMASEINSDKMPAPAIQGDKGISPKVIAAIGAAIHQHRNSN
jgi:oxaloacetate decarboxylase gamma subunit